ncbi:MAG: metal-dependent hydrolase [Pseudomonadota bacterium]
MNALSRSIELEPRNEHFHFEAAGRRDWHSGDPVKTIFFNALSVTFPEGEKFFMDSVKAYRDQIEDPVLRDQIKGFLMQEAMHTREHVGYNKELDAQGFSATKLHLESRKLIQWTRRVFGPFRQLSVTCALEHFTAMLADQLMSDPAYLDGADEVYRKVWLWHSVEEAEHKGVAFDTLRAVATKNSYFLRCRSMIAVTLLFNYIIFRFAYVMLKDVGLSRSPKAWGNLAWFLLGKPGLYRRIFLPWLAYFKPGFHPWEHDNRRKLAETEEALLGRPSVYASALEAQKAVPA